MTSKSQPNTFNQQAVPGGEGGHSASSAPWFSPPYVTQGISGGEGGHSWLSPHDVTQEGDGGESTSCLLPPPDVMQDTPGAEGASHSTNSAPRLFLPVVTQDVPREKGGDSASSASPPDGMQDVPREKAGDPTSRDPSASPQDVAQPPSSRNGKATDFFCSKCKTPFRRKQELTRHRKQTKNHGGPKKQCTLCGKLLSREHTLRVHMLKCKGR